MSSQFQMPDILRTNDIGNVIVVVRPCPWWAILCTALVVSYVLAAASYMCISKIALKTPFSDSLTPQQQAIKSASARQRSVVFWVSFGVALLVSGAVGCGIFFKR